MQRHELVHEINCPPERMWELYFDDEFNRRMYCEGLGFPKCETVEKREQGGILHRRMVMIPKVELPKAVQKMVGDRVGFEEIGDWDKAAGVFRWKLILAAFGDKVRVEGTMRLQPFGNGHCKRITAFESESKVFGVGGLLEKTAADNVIGGWNASAKWINAWLARSATPG